MNKIGCDKRLLSVLSSSLPIARRPFALWADKLKIKEEELLRIIKNCLRQGTIRRLGAVLNHRKIGLKDNVLVAWEVGDGKIDSVAKFICSLPEVSHCYKRKTGKHWPYNLYTMIHCLSKNECRSIVRKISKHTGVANRRLFFTEREFKKTRFKL